MRLGNNPTKIGKLVERTVCDHRVIIPLHIPNEEDYYKDTYRIFELCLYSVRKTTHSPLKISVVSNGSSVTINQRLNILYSKGYIDELIIEREGIGKVNSILKSLRTAEERLITITDADVLFKNGWEDKVLQIFESFPKAGAVSPVPVFRKHFELTHNIWFDYFFNSKLQFEPVTNEEELEMFAKSLGWLWLEPTWKDTILKLQATNGIKAVVGCPHFCATYKREVFENLPKENSIYKILGDSEYKYTDLPVLKNDGYRLSTDDNFAFHLGNIFEPRMQERFNALYEEVPIYRSYTHLPLLKRNKVAFYVKQILFKRILKKTIFTRYAFQKKGLTQEQILNFMGNDYD
ncbi:glycosyltransferase [Flavobacterium davisii]|uniref:Glycosyltransferase family 2 protein n=1 Tax=Flavobacterium columnare TaxID=996 RepID=A0A8G0P7Z2_9FLAO|nr:glycosyltransferase [Flavobacterium davisii]QYS89429.1 glycosyltransferase family 2 protein [Flavobacterium davisii]